jgi:hypothetical protein
MNLYDLNVVLSSLKLFALNSIYDFDVAEFVDELLHSEEISYSYPNCLTHDQALGVDYLRKCRERAVDDLSTLKDLATKRYVLLLF